MNTKDFNSDHELSEQNTNEEYLSLIPPDEGGEPPYGEPPYEPPQGDQSSPIGWLDWAEGGWISGWSFDPDNPSASNDVHLYIGGPAGSGAAGFAVTANQPRPDVNQALGVGGDHGFSFQIPPQYANGQQYAVYAYGIDTGANNPQLLQGSPKYFVLNPPPPAIGLHQVSPLAGGVAGGLSVTLHGSGFQPGAAVYFGNTPAAQMTVESDSVIHAVTPQSAAPGSVTVAVINPDGSSVSLEGGFTYVSTEMGQQAEVVGISPLAVLENTQSELTIRGRNLIQAYNSGVFALRGPSRCQVSFSNVTTSHDAATGLDTVKVLANVQCSPALQPLERLAVQVLASTRPEAANDGVVQTSKQMFTVLPKSVPVPLAYTASLTPNQPNLVMVSGRNLDGYQLSLDNGAEVTLQKSSDKFVSGIVHLPENYDTSQPVQLLVKDAGGVQVDSFQMQVEQLLQAAQPEEYLSLAPPDETSLSLQAVPGQQFIGPTEADSSVFSLNSLSWGGYYNWSIFEITILDLTIILPIVNEVHLIPFFDGGGDDLNSPVLAEVGKIFRLRGAGLLVAYRIEVQIHIRVAVIIGFYTYTSFGWGYWNEFPELDWGIGTVVLGVRVEVQVLVLLSFLLALVKPNGQLQILASVNLTAGIDFTIDNNGLHFDPEFTHQVNVIGINPVPTNPTPCGNKFELLPQNGLAAVPGALGFEAQYAVHEAGDCCLLWDFNAKLLRFRSTGQPEVVQEGFQTTYCLTAQPRQFVDIKIEPVLMYMKRNKTTGDLIPDNTNPTLEEAINGLERLEPHEMSDNIPAVPANPSATPPVVGKAAVPPKPLREYVLAAKITALPSTPNVDVKITFPSVNIALNPATPIVPKTGVADLPDSRGTQSNVEDFFTNDLFDKTNLSLTIPQNTVVGAIIPFTDGTGANKKMAIITPNQFEDPAGTKFVIPGSDVTGKDVEVKISFPTSSSPLKADNGDDVTISDGKFSVKNQETYEEYYRVFKELRNILHPTSTTSRVVTKGLSKFAEKFHTDLKTTSDLKTFLKTNGQALWTSATEFVQGEGTPKANGIKDDRPLYYARLEAMAVLRAYLKNATLPSGLSVDEALNIFEWSSRGLETTDGKDVSIKFGTNPRKVLVTGYDPFQLYYGGTNLTVNNSSGIIALEFDKAQGVGENNSPGFVTPAVELRSAVFPVRFRDFGRIDPATNPTGEGLIEKVMNKAVMNCRFIMTCSWTGDKRFNIDRFATRYSTTTTPDNEGNNSTKDLPLGPLAGSLTPNEPPQTIESTLPYSLDITTENRKASSLVSKKVGLGNIDLILNQGFKQGSTDISAAPSSTALVDSPDSYKKSVKPDKNPKPELEVERGPGGSYLSNEIFYRTANVRRKQSENLPTGHLHVPPIDGSQFTGNNIQSGAMVILESMLNHTILTGKKRIVFENTLVGSNSVVKSVTLTNSGTTDIVISDIETPAQFKLMTSPKNFTIAGGASKVLEFRFDPTAVGYFGGTANLIVGTGTNAKVVTAIQLEGQGLGVLTFAPASGPAGTEVTITGTNFTGATEVRIGQKVPGSINTAGTELKATITIDAFTSRIEVDAPGGNSASAAEFKVRPTIDSITYPSGVTSANVAGKLLTIIGKNFIGLIEVKIIDINGVSISIPASAVKSIAKDKIELDLPSINSGTFDIEVVTNGGSHKSPNQLTVAVVPIQPPPTYATTAFSPNGGLVGSSFTINGQNFTGATSVKIGGVSASFTVNNDTQITATVPPGVSSSTVEVVTPGGNVTSSEQFTVLQPPIIYTFQPSYGGQYSMVTIYGENLDDAYDIRMGGSSMSIASSSSTHISAYVSAEPGYYLIEVYTSNGVATTENNGGYFQVTSEIGY
jgi:IPT/TIG domain